VGQLLLATFTVQGFILFALSSVLLSLAVVPVALTRSPGPSIPAPSRLNLRSLWRLSPLGVTGCVASGLVLGAFYGLAPIFGQRMGLDADGIAWFMGATIIGGMALQWPVGRLSDRVDRRLAILGNGLGMSVVSIGLVIATAMNFDSDGLELLPFGTAVRPDAEAIPFQFDLWIAPLAVLFGTLAFTLYPLSVAQAIDYAASDDVVPMSGGLVLAYSVGALAGPVTASLLMEQLGPLGLFTFTAGVGVLLGLFALWRIRTAPTLAMEDQAPYQPVPRTSVVAYEMDPRHDDEQLTLELDEPRAE
jgi:MFS family permease